MIKKYEGIVISTVDYKENSKIINILTKEDGIVGVMARGAKRVKSNISEFSNVLSYGYFYTEGKFSNNLVNLKDGEVVNSFKNIRKDIIKLNYAIYLIELSTQVYRHENNNNIYKLLIDCLIKINDGFEPRMITNILELKLLEYLAIKPEIDKCICCGNTDNIVTISSHKGGYLCSNCTYGESMYDIKTIKLIRMFYYVNIGKISKLDISNNIKDELGMFISDYYDRYSGLYLKSKIFLEKFSNI